MGKKLSVALLVTGVVLFVYKLTELTVTSQVSGANLVISPITAPILIAGASLMSIGGYLLFKLKVKKP